MRNDTTRRTIPSDGSSWYIHIQTSLRIKTLLKFFIAKMAYEGWTEEERLVATELVLRFGHPRQPILAFYAKLIEILLKESQRYSIFKPLFYLKQFHSSSLMTKHAYFGMKNFVNFEFRTVEYGYQPRKSYRRGVSPSGYHSTSSNSSINWEEIQRHFPYEDDKPVRVISILSYLGGILFQDTS